MRSESWIYQESLGYNIFRALLLRSASTRLVRVDLKHFIIFVSSSYFFHERLIQGHLSTWSRLIPSRLVLKTPWRLVTADSHSRDWKLRSLYILQTPTHFSYRVTPTQIYVTFSLPFVYRKTQVLVKDHYVTPSNIKSNSYSKHLELTHSRAAPLRKTLKIHPKSNCRTKRDLITRLQTMPSTIKYKVGTPF